MRDERLRAEGGDKGDESGKKYVDTKDVALQDARKETEELIKWIVGSNMLNKSAAPSASRLCLERPCPPGITKCALPCSGTSFRPAPGGTILS